MCSHCVCNRNLILETLAGVQPTARGPHAAEDGHARSPAQNRKFTKTL